MRRGVLLPLAVLTLAGCGSAAESEWPGPPQPAADGRLSVKGFDDHLAGYEDYARSPEALATEFLRLDEQRGATTSLVTGEAPEAVTGRPSWRPWRESRTTPSSPCATPSS